MLKDNYIFKYNEVAACSLVEAIKSKQPKPHEQVQYFLCLFTLEKMMAKLLLYCISKRDVGCMMHKAVGGKQPLMKLRVNRVEALAIHHAYRHGFVDTKNPFVQEIFTAIDRTL